jgi:lysozyme
MKSSQILINAIKRFEGVRLQAYQDSVGVWTIGYGHTKDVKKGDRITQYQAEQMLKEDLAQFEAVASKVRNVNTQGKFDAVVDFMFNLGAGSFNSSTLRKYIECNKATWEIQEQFLRWVYAGHQKLGGLVTRRIWEASRFAE